MGKYKILAVTNVTPTILGITLERCEGEKLFAYLPGQYAGFSFSKHGRQSAVRCFSIASSPTNQDILEFGIRIGGKFTHALTSLQAGDIVQIQGPYGSFTFDSHQQKEIIMCAGGIGITPFMSMMRYATQLHLENKLTLIFSVRNQDDIPYFEELNSMAVENQNLKIAFVIDSGDVNKIPLHHKIFKGRISTEVLDNVAKGKFASQSFFICGPPPFMKGTASNLSELGVSRERIITEAFSQGPHKMTGKSRGWPFNIYTMGAIGTAAAGVALLTNDLLKSIPPTLLPDKLTQDIVSGSTRSQDIDELINGYQLALANAKSPAVLSAENDVVVAQAKVDEVNRLNAQNTGSTYTPSKTSTTTTQTSTPVQSSTPTPTPKPVCTTTSKGTVCK